MQSDIWSADGTGSELVYRVISLYGCITLRGVHSVRKYISLREYIAATVNTRSYFYSEHTPLQGVYIHARSEYRLSLWVNTAIGSVVRRVPITALEVHIATGTVGYTSMIGSTYRYR